MFGRLRQRGSLMLVATLYHKKTAIQRPFPILTLEKPEHMEARV